MKGPLADIMTLLALHARPMFVQREKDLGVVPKKDEIDVAGSMLFFANMLKYVERTLGFQGSRLFRKKDLPAPLQLVPTEQFLDRYVVLTPSEWEWDFLVVTRQAGVDIDLDGAAIDDAAFVASAGGWEVARVPVEDGVHQLVGSAPFSVAVVGYALADSYAYMGGSGTGLINPEPEG